MKYTVEQVVEFKQMVSWDKDAITTSRKVAEFFGKEHHNILKKIDSMIKDMPSDFSKVNFNVRLEINELQNGKKTRFYELTKNGFMFVAMSLTGKEAAKWKVRFIQAFDWLVEQHHSMQMEIDSFTRANQASISNGSFHGRGLANRRREKKALEIREIEIQNKWQLNLC